MSFLQIGSWNIEHLSGSARANRRQSVYALADHIEMAGVDLIVLQEIYITPADEELQLFENQPVITSRAQSERRNADLDAVCYLLEEHLDTPWQYIILPNRNPADDSQLCAAMWNTSRLRLSNILPLNVSHSDGGDSLWDRKPHLLTFSSQIDVWRRSETGEWQQQSEGRSISVVPLHMKSNVGGVTKNRRVRQKEAATLCDALAAAKVNPGYDPSLMMLGDTNILANDEPAIEEFINRGFTDLNNNDGKTFWSRDFGESPFDRAFLAAERPEFRYTRQYVLRSSDLELHDRLLSDHYMIKVSVKDYIDDADPRLP